MKQILLSGLLAATFISTSALAKDMPPKETSGLDVQLYHNHSLGAQLAPMEGYTLRGRRITFAPGGGTNEHSHADRPGIVYVLEGTLDEHRGDTKRVVVAGDTWVEEADTVHWIKNTSDKPAVVLAFDLVKAE